MHPSSLVADRLGSLGCAVTTGIAGTGVVGGLLRGTGPTVLLHADMDALPVLEETGLDYASTAHGVDADGMDVPLMHACGHDVHVTCMLGAAEELAAADDWAGTLVVLLQPAEEWGGGAERMVADGLFDRVPIPDVVLGQHVAPFPAGSAGLHAGVAMAAADSIDITLHGEGGHGSRPETTVDPVYLAANVGSGGARVRLRGALPADRERAGRDRPHPYRAGGGAGRGPRDRSGAGGGQRGCRRARDLD